ncbi:hypothetical protein [Pseudolysobacter antarcticus]|uniref:hypothetical protein n=1 Tax=Pseudolysobacter antarcticus TaxID=2511995 RepID=UPI0013ECED12|nr:hypothetical protein [Pseudolysobacter antarcticus]
MRQSFLPRLIATAGLGLGIATASHAGSTITVTTGGNSVDFAATGSGATTLVRPSWDMVVQTGSAQPSPSTGVWVPGSGAPSVAQLVADLATRGDGKISLREAIVIANATQYSGSEIGPTTIVFDTAAMGGTLVTLDGPDNWWYGPNGLPPIYSNIVIDGGSGVTIQRINLSSNTSNPFRLMYVAGKFHNLVDGKTPPVGAPAYTQGNLTLRHITLQNGLAQGGDTRLGGGGAGLGGAIYSQGLLTLDQSVVTQNQALGGASGRTDGSYASADSGGGLGGAGSSFSGGGMRYAGLNADGGGFLSQQPRVEGGQAYLDATGGGLGGSSRFGGNGANGSQPKTVVCSTFASGGGFISSATATNRGDGGGYSSKCTGGGGGFGGGGGGYPYFTANLGGGGGVGGGGALYSDGGYGGGGGLAAYGGFGGGSGVNIGAWGFAGGSGDPSFLSRGGGGAGLGGGVFNHTGTLTAKNGSSINTNLAVGGSGYGGGGGYGGGVFNLDGQVLIDASTITGNTVTGGGSSGGGIGGARGGALYNRYQSEDVGVVDLDLYRNTPFSPSLTLVTLRNATLSGSIGGFDCFTDGGMRQESGADEVYVGYLKFEGNNTIATDSAGINSCGNFNHRGVLFTFSIKDDGAGDFNAQGWLATNSLFQQNLRAAAAIWAREFDIDGVTLRVLVQADNSVPRMSGGAYPGASLGTIAGLNEIEPSSRSKLRLGASPARPYDLRISVNTAFVVANYWLDPTPLDRNDNAIASSKTDQVSIVLHEMEHGLGMDSYRSFAADSTYGKFVLENINLLDVLTQLANPSDPTSAPYFIGVQTEAAFSGSQVPLAHWGPTSPNVGSDFTHFAATCSNRFDTSIDKRLRYALMSNCPVPTDGTYNTITPLDRGVLRDIGYPLVIFHDNFELQNTDALTHP